MRDKKCLKKEVGKTLRKTRQQDHRVDGKQGSGAEGESSEGGKT